MSHDSIAQPECCVLSGRPSLSERLYVTYQQGGPPERAGLSWDGKPCPTWRVVEFGPVGAKWGAVAAEVERACAALAQWAEQRALRVAVECRDHATLKAPQQLDDLVLSAVRQSHPELAGVLRVPAQEELVERTGRYRAQVLIGDSVIWAALYVVPLKGGA